MIKIQGTRKNSFTPCFLEILKRKTLTMKMEMTVKGDRLSPPESSPDSARVSRDELGLNLAQTYHNHPLRVKYLLTVGQ